MHGQPAGAVFVQGWLGNFMARLSLGKDLQ
jgi:hypothetical protein